MTMAAGTPLCCAGLGLTLGAAEIDSIIVLDSQKAVDAFTKNQVITRKLCHASSTAVSSSMQLRVTCLVQVLGS